jgi:Ni/Co efflux regulator RcnB
MKIILIAALAAALALPATASFAAHDNGRHRGHNPYANQYGDWNNDTRAPDAWTQRYPNAVVAPPHWSRGDRLYRSYWGPNYYVDDWQSHHLRRPPRGYRWVHVDNDYLLVAITTGIIFQIMLNQDRGGYH